jgi:hypothetical protein
VSDKRLKSSHTKAPGLSAILALEPLKYKHWESLEAASQASMLGENFQYKIGFFAQDVEKILPEAVQQPSGPEDLYAMDYNCILACAIQAIKELADQVFHLESRLSKGFKD